MKCYFFKVKIEYTLVITNIQVVEMGFIPIKSLNQVLRSDFQVL